MKTPLVYYGGKQQLARQIVSLMPAHRVYLEPFAGGAAVLFAKPRAERETLNDVDHRVMRFWRALRDRPADQPDAVIYCDPPYALSTRRESAKGFRHDADSTFWTRLVGVLHGVRHAAVLLSGYPCAETDDLG